MRFHEGMRYLVTVACVALSCCAASPPAAPTPASAGGPARSIGGRPLSDPGVLQGPWVVVGYRSSEPILGKSQEGPVAALQTSLLVDSHGYVYESPYRGIRHVPPPIGYVIASGDAFAIVGRDPGSPSGALSLEADGSLRLTRDEQSSLRLVRPVGTEICASADGRSFDVQWMCRPEQVAVGEVARSAP